MKRSLWVLGALLVPAFAAHLALAAGFFKVGEKAPSFTLTAITGETVSLESYKGKVVVLGLFHICEPCMIHISNSLPPDHAAADVITAEVEKLLASPAKM